MKSTNIFLLLFITINCLFAQNQSKILISVHFEKETIFRLDPWNVKINLSNQGSDTLKVYIMDIQQGRANQFGLIELEYMEDTDSIWRSTKQIVNFGKEYGSFVSPPNLTIELNPNQTIVSNFYLPPLLISSDKVSIRASYYVYAFGCKIYSTVHSINLVNYEGADSLAYNYLKSLPKPDFIFYPLYAVQYKLSDTAYAKYVCKQFPKSKFALYGNLFLSNIYLGMAIKSGIINKDKELGIGYLRHCKFYGHSLLTSRVLQFTNKGDETLRKMSNILFQIYESDPPAALIEEFLYPPKH